MAERPIFVADPDSCELVKEIFVAFEWHSGFARVQKEKNIKALHDAAEVKGFSKVLEVSTKSESVRGRHLSAFYLKMVIPGVGKVPLESAFQGSKKFELGGPFTDIYEKSPKDAKHDPRLQSSGRLVGFRFMNADWPLEPKTVFYDWLYASCVYPHRDWATKLITYSGFSDIEFNPVRSVNCQARSIALFVSLLQREELDEAMRSPAEFQQVLGRSAYRPKLHTDRAHFNQDRLHLGNGHEHEHAIRH